MPIPKFHEIMLPLLELYSDGKIHHRRDFIEKLEYMFNLSEEEKTTKIKAGWTQFTSRVHWASSFLKNAELLHSPSRGFLQITPRGMNLLSKKLKTLSVDDLENLYPDILKTKFFNPKLRNKKDQFNDVEISPLLDYKSTPDELLDQIIEQKTLETQSEILEQIKNISPRAFENLVVKLLVAMGYGTKEFSLTTSYTNDGGIDGIVQKDELGFEKVYIQAKKYENNVGRPDIQKFVGAMTGTSKGVFITTAKFASSVTDYLKSRQENIVLIDGEKMVELMYKHNQGVSVRQIIEIKSIDTDYFEELLG